MKDIPYLTILSLWLEESYCLAESMGEGCSYTIAICGAAVGPGGSKKMQSTIPTIAEISLYVDDIFVKS